MMRRLVGLVGCGVALAGVAFGGVPAVGSPAAGTASLASASAPKKAPAVGSVTSLGGTRKLQLQVGGKGTARAVKVGASLRLGDRLTLGRGTTATIKLTRPKSVAEGTVLVLIRSATGTSHRSKVSRKGRTTTIVVKPVKAAARR